MKTRVIVVASAVLALGACSSGTDSGSTDMTATPTSDSMSNTSSDSTVSVPENVTIAVTVGVDSSPERVEQVALGSQVTLALTNPNEDDEFHLHGYDLSPGETPKGETATITFTADKIGEFEVESHHTEDVLVVINVS
jgi:ABC-type Fe3+-hydroxamate transport system substrate-binding protein